MAVRLSEMQKAIEAQPQQIQQLVEQVKPRQSDPQTAATNESGAKLGFTGATSRRCLDIGKYTGRAEHYVVSCVGRNTWSGVGGEPHGLDGIDLYFVPLLLNVACSSLTPAISLSFCGPDPAGGLGETKRSTESRPREARPGQNRCVHSLAEGLSGFRREHLAGSGGEKGVQIPYGCRQGLCGTCATRVLSLSGTVEMDVEAGLTSEQKNGGYVLRCVSRTCGTVVVTA